MAKKPKQSPGIGVGVRPLTEDEIRKREMMTVEQSVQERCQMAIQNAHETLAKLAALPPEVRNLPISSLHAVGHYF